MSKILLIVGARPNFMKMAPLYFAMSQTEGIEPVIVHTGQHYDYIMSQAFFEDLDLPEPHSPTIANVSASRKERLTSVTATSVWFAASR